MVKKINKGMVATQSRKNGKVYTIFRKVSEELFVMCQLPAGGRRDYPLYETLKNIVYFSVFPQVSITTLLVLDREIHWDRGTRETLCGIVFPARR